MDYDYTSNLNKNISDEDREHFTNMSVFIIFLVVIIGFIMKKRVIKQEVPPSLNNIMFIGSEIASKTTFFNYMIRGKITNIECLENKEIYTINNVKIFNKSKWLYDLMNIPPYQEFGKDILINLKKTKLILCFIKSLDETFQEILYEIITHTNFNKETFIYIIANKENECQISEESLKPLIQRLPEKELFNNIQIVETKLSTNYQELRNLTTNILI